MVPEPTDKKFRISEIFGPTIQGEGQIIGAQTHFIRFGGCDYRCSWCDSMYAVAPEEVAKLPRLSVDEIMAKVSELPGSPAWVTLSGGNPALFDLGELVEMLHDNGYKVAVETQGTVYKSWLTACDLVTVSPKPPSSGNETDPADFTMFLLNLDNEQEMGIGGEFLYRELWEYVAVKVVVFDENDYQYARNVFTLFHHIPKWVQVGNPVVTGEGPTHKGVLLDRLRWLCERVVKDADMGEVRVTPQLHTLIWGNERGR